MHSLLTASTKRKNKEMSFLYSPSLLSHHRTKWVHVCLPDTTKVSRWYFIFSGNPKSFPLQSNLLEWNIGIQFTVQGNKYFKEGKTEIKISLEKYKTMLGFFLIQQTVNHEFLRALISVVCLVTSQPPSFCSPCKTIKRYWVDLLVSWMRCSRMCRQSVFPIGWIWSQSPSGDRSVSVSAPAPSCPHTAWHKNCWHTWPKKEEIIFQFPKLLFLRKHIKWLEKEMGSSKRILINVTTAKGV